MDFIYEVSLKAPKKFRGNKPSTLHKGVEKIEEVDKFEYMRSFEKECNKDRNVASYSYTCDNSKFLRIFYD